MKALLPAIAIAGFLISGCSSLGGRNDAGWLPGPAVDSDSQVVEIWVSDPECPAKLTPEDVSVTVAESDDEVIITATTPQRNGACSFSNPSTAVSVELEAPLGERLLLDGRKDPPSRPVNDFGGGGMPLG